MTSVLAVDGGQSGIRMTHSDDRRVIEVDGVVRSTDTVGAVVASLSAALTTAGFPPADRVVLGLTTAPATADDGERLSGLVASMTQAREVWIANDTITAHRGALSGGHGVCLVVGTGVACLAVPLHGRPRTFDGHGYLLGDEGGAFWIGRRALRSALRDYDREQSSGLVDLVRAHFGDLDALHVRLHEVQSPVNEIAQFAREVLGAAEDPAVGRVLDAAAESLLATALDAAAVIDTSTIPLALGGRLLDDNSSLRRRLDVLLRERTDISARSADGTPLDGAVTLGAQDSPGRYHDLVHIWQRRSAA